MWFRICICRVKLQWISPSINFVNVFMFLSKNSAAKNENLPNIDFFIFLFILTVFDKKKELTAMVKLNESYFTEFGTIAT